MVQILLLSILGKKINRIFWLENPTFSLRKIPRIKM